jgi:predicted nucleic acid-binding protein
MRIPKIYIETTIFNYYFDADRDAHKSTVKLFNEIKSGKFDAYTSRYAIEELSKTQEPKQGQMLNLIKTHGIKLFEASAEAERLGEIYKKEGAVPTTANYDALHIAITAIKELDYICSLNFKHINRIKTKEMVAVINKREGYRSDLTICSPMEVVGDE